MYILQRLAIVGTLLGIFYSPLAMCEPLNATIDSYAVTSTTSDVTQRDPANLSGNTNGADSEPSGPYAVVFLHPRVEYYPDSQIGRCYTKDWKQFLKESKFCTHHLECSDFDSVKDGRLGKMAFVSPGTHIDYDCMVANFFCLQANGTFVPQGLCLPGPPTPHH